MNIRKIINLRKIQNIILVILSIYMILIFFQNQQVLAVDNIQVIANKETIEKEEEIEIMVSLPNKSITSMTLEIYFDMAKLEYVNKTENSNFSGNRIIYTWTDARNENNSLTEKFTFKALQDGMANIVVTGEFYDGSGDKVEINDGSMQVQIGKNEEKLVSENRNESNSTTKDETNGDNQEESRDNTNLKIMRLDHVGISPEFQKNIKEYYFLADMYINKLEVTAIPENKNAKVKVSGNTNLKQGLNTIKIEVQSEDKTKKSTYKIYVTKTSNKELANSNLENLAVKEGILFPYFDTNITHYALEVANSVSKLEILAIPQNANSKVAIEGNNELKLGDNAITINVTAEDGITSKKYVIMAHRRNEQEEIEESKKQEIQKEQLSAVLANEEVEGVVQNEDRNEKGQNKIEKMNMETVDVITFALLGVIVIGFVIGFIINKRKNFKQ